jgi:hypothetical protein
MYSAIWTYPWDFLDEGVDTALSRIADAGLSGVSMATAYHTVRALCPHNPRRAVYHGEGGVIYFHPEGGFFAGNRIQPVVSELAADIDPLAEVCNAAEKHGLKVHAWTVLHHNTRLGTAFPDCTIENAFGDRYPFGLCPAHPDVRAYTVALVKSLAARGNLDTIELESLGYMGIDHSGHHAKQGIEMDTLHKFLLSICFCAHCQSKMQAHGVDTDKARNGVAEEMRSYFGGRFHTKVEDALESFEEILGADQAGGILGARDEVVLTLLEEIYWLVKKPQCLSVMVTGSPLATGAQAGITLSQAREWTDRLLTQAFSKEISAIKSAVSDIAVRRGSAPVYAGLQAITPFVNSREELVERVQAVSQAGAEGVQFYHYGLMPLENLSWIKEALHRV